MVTMSRLNRDFQWAIRDKQSLLRACWERGWEWELEPTTTEMVDAIEINLQNGRANHPDKQIRTVWSKLNDCKIPNRAS